MKLTPNRTPNCISKPLALIFAVFSLSTVAMADDAAQVAVHDPYIRLAPPNAPAAGAFMVLRNQGALAVKLVKADNTASRVTELHTHLNENGVMKMRPVPAIDIPAKGEAVLQPGGLHVMLIDLKAPLQEGEVVPITLTFGDGSQQQVATPVRRTAPASGQASPHKH